MTNKSNIWISSFLLIGMLLMLTISCTKDDDPAIKDDDPAIKTVTDIDGNVYHTVTIGTQVWMVENLKTTKYRDGTSIPNVTDNTVWSNLTTGSYCDYKNTPSHSSTYGRLYNWYAVTDAHNIAPTGWHVATDADWSTLTAYLGGEGVAGGKLKEIGTTHWQSPNTGATNEAGFTALPGGYRFEVFGTVGDFGVWWSATGKGSGSPDAWARGVSYDDGSIVRHSGDKEVGASVRCVRD